MSNDINTVLLVGRLTRDPELRTLPSGMSVCGLGIASNESFTSNGERQERANFVDVTVWGKQAENCAQYLSKGRQVAIRGSLRYQAWEKDGQKRSKLEVNAQEVQFLGDGSGARRSESDIPIDESDFVSPQADNDDDIPF
jgi:single-strand DNA-binding protein